MRTGRPDRAGTNRHAPAPLPGSLFAPFPASVPWSWPSPKHRAGPVRHLAGFREPEDVTEHSQLAPPLSHLLPQGRWCRCLLQLPRLVCPVLQPDSLVLTSLQFATLSHHVCSAPLRFRDQARTSLTRLGSLSFTGEDTGRRSRRTEIAETGGGWRCFGAELWKDALSQLVCRGMET